VRLEWFEYLLINRLGLVERTRPEYVKDQPRPDRSFVIAAEAAALEWSFSPNFGLEPKHARMVEIIVAP